VKITDDHLDFGADEAGASNHDDLRFASPTEGSVEGSHCERERILRSAITQRSEACYAVA